MWAQGCGAESADSFTAAAAILNHVNGFMLHWIDNFQIYAIAIQHNDNDGILYFMFREIRVIIHRSIED